MPSQQVQPSASPLDFLFEVFDFVAGLGILTMSLSPLAIPCIALVLVPAMVLGLLGGLAVAVLSLPVLLVRGAVVAARRARTPREHAAGAATTRPVSGT